MDLYPQNLFSTKFSYIKGIQTPETPPQYAISSSVFGRVKHIDRPYFSKAFDKMPKALGDIYTNR
jgi:hypothetical protein